MLDPLLYGAFGKDGHAAEVHEELRQAAEAQQKLVILLEGWSDQSSSAWPVVDAVVGVPRSSADGVVIAYLRSNVLLYASSMLRRFELQLLHNAKPSHDLTCQECSPDDEAKAAAWQRLRSKRSCCLNFFCRRLAEVFPGPGDEQGVRASHAQHGGAKIGAAMSDKQLIQAEGVLESDPEVLGICALADEAMDVAAGTPIVPARPGPTAPSAGASKKLQST